MVSLDADGTSSTGAGAALRRAAVRAASAASVRDTQPWRLQLGERSLEVHADRSRQLEVVDPRARHLTISCGCALFNARRSLAGDGVPVRVSRRTDPRRPTLLARIVARESGLPDPTGVHELAGLGDVRLVEPVALREAEVDDAVLTSLEHAAAAEGVHATVARTTAQRTQLAALAEVADVIERLNPGVEAERRAWTVATGRRPASTRETPTYHARSRFVLLDGARDEHEEWLRAGEALQRLLLELARHGLAAALLLQVTDVPVARAQLRRSLAPGREPLALLCIGAADGRGGRRRRLADVLDDRT